MDTLTVMPVAPLDPISAVTAPDPYEFYSELVAERPLYFDDRLHLWVASSAETVAAVLANPRCRVRPVSEPVPRPLVGSVAGDVFGSLVRMSDGDRHRALKNAVERAFESLPLPTVERAARGQVRTFAAPDRAPADGSAVTRFAFRFPILVIAALLGVSESSSLRHCRRDAGVRGGPRAGLRHPTAGHWFRSRRAPSSRHWRSTRLPPARIRT